VFFTLTMAVALSFVFLNFSNSTDQSHEIDNINVRLEEQDVLLQALQTEVTILSNFINTHMECIEELCEHINTTLPCWNAFLNEPVLASGTQGVNRQAYVVCVDGNTTLDGSFGWVVVDQVVFAQDISIWTKTG